MKVFRFKPKHLYHFTLFALFRDSSRREGCKISQSQKNELNL